MRPNRFGKTTRDVIFGSRTYPEGSVVEFEAARFDEALASGAVTSHPGPAFDAGVQPETKGKGLPANVETR